MARRWSLAGFYERRARRILPPLFVVVLACIPLAWLFMLPEDLANFARSITAVSVFASNVLFWLQTGYFERAGEFKPLLHTWSLAVEEQFYLLFPLLLLLMWRSSRPVLAAVFTAILVVSLAIAQWCAAVAPAAGFYLLPSRGWELALGALLTLAGPGLTSRVTKTPLADLLGLAGLAMILAAVLLFDADTPTPSVWTLIPTGGAALVILAAHPGNSAGALLAQRPFVWLGLISYSAYLWHLPIIVFARFAELGAPPIVFGAAVLAASLLLAALTWWLIERPFRNRQTIGLGTFLATVLTMILLANLFAAFVLLRKDGDDPRLSGMQRQLMATATRSPMGKQCHILQGRYRAPKDSCRFFVDNPDIAVLGNSHGVGLSYALALKLRDQGRGVMQLTFSSCPPAYGRILRERPLCTRWTQEAVDYLANNPDISTVVMSYYTNGLAGFEKPTSQDKGAAEDMIGDDEVMDDLWQSYVATMARLQKAGKTVILVLQAPHLAAHVETFVTGVRTKADLAFTPGVARQRWDASREAILSRLASVPKGVQVIDPADLFCDQQNCAAIKDGSALYFDEHHMSLAAAGLVADRIMPLLPDPPSNWVRQTPSQPVEPARPGQNVPPPPEPSANPARQKPALPQPPTATEDTTRQVPAPPSPPKPSGN